MTNTDLASVTETQAPGFQRIACFVKPMVGGSRPSAVPGSGPCSPRPGPIHVGADQLRTGRGIVHRVAAERHVRETSLAWALADATKPHLNAVERSDVHVTIGVGETFAAIGYLIASAAGKRI